MIPGLNRDEIKIKTTTCPVRMFRMRHFKRNKKAISNKVVPVQNDTTLLEPGIVAKTEQRGKLNKESKSILNLKVDKILKNMDDPKPLDFGFKSKVPEFEDREHLKKMERFEALYGETIVKNLTSLQDRITEIFSIFTQETTTFTSNPFNTLGRNDKKSKYKQLFREFDMILWIISRSLAVVNKRQIMVVLDQAFLQKLNTVSIGLKSLHEFVKTKRTDIKHLKNQIHLLKKIFEEEFPKSICDAKSLYHKYELKSNTSSKDFDQNSSNSAKGTVQFKINSDGYSVLSYFPKKSNNIWKNVSEIHELGLKEIVDGLFNEIIERIASANKVLSTKSPVDETIEATIEKLFRLTNIGGIQIQKSDSVTILFTVYKVEKLLIQFKDNLVQALDMVVQALHRIKYMKTCLQARKFKSDSLCVTFKDSIFKIQLHTKWAEETKVFVNRSDDSKEHNFNGVNFESSNPLDVPSNESDYFKLNENVADISCARCSTSKQDITTTSS